MNAKLPLGSAWIDAAERVDVLTPMGMVSASALASLREFGQSAERLEYPCIDVGGFIVPGDGPAESNRPGMEPNDHGESARGAWGRESARQEAGPAAGPRQRPPSPKAAPGASPHTVEHRLTTFNLDLPGLVRFHPLTRFVASTETVVHFNIPVGVFREFDIGARLTLEVPLLPRDQLTRKLPLSGVPDVRAWALWEGGPMHGTRIVGHHQNPDGAICASMPGEWIRSVHPLLDYVAFCILWVAKVLHERLVGFYPGPQHCSVVERVRRGRPNEYCGCGTRRRYKDCCCDKDSARTPYNRWREARLGQLQYLTELMRQGRSTEAPTELLALGLSHAEQKQNFAGQHS